MERFFTKCTISNTNEVNNLRKPDITDPKSVAMFLKRRELEMMSPQGIKNFFEAGASGTLTIQPLEISLLSQYPEIYARALDRIILERIFRAITKYSTSVYAEFKKLIPINQLLTERKKVSQLGFSSHSEQAEQLILMQYFVRFGGLFLDGKRTNGNFSKIPKSFLDFFRKYLFGETIRETITEQKRLPSNTEDKA